MAIITTKTRAAAAQDAILATINNTGGPAAGALKLYTGAAPANLAAAVTGTLLATCVLVDGSHAAFAATDTTTLVATGYVSGGYWAQDTSPVATGTIGYWRLFDYAGTGMLQGTVGTAGTVDITFNTLTVTTGVLVQITSMTVTISGVT
jgi:hypothetical protein